MIISLCGSVGFFPLGPVALLRLRGPDALYHWRLVFEPPHRQRQRAVKEFENMFSKWAREASNEDLRLKGETMRKQAASSGARRPPPSKDRADWPVWIGFQILVDELSYRAYRDHQLKHALKTK